jgi:hypothetical protein
LESDKVNTLYADVHCPFCNEKVTSGVGFKVGALTNKSYRIGDKLNWKGAPVRPEKPPAKGDITSIGYFNCDNIRCSTWQDCYPQVQQAFILVKNNVLVAVELADSKGNFQSFEITESE